MSWKTPKNLEGNDSNYQIAGITSFDGQAPRTGPS